jgi:hypothetical protein
LKSFKEHNKLMTVKDTLEFIKTAHAGQMYGSNPYWVHPKTVADKLTKEQALYVANIFSNYFDRFERIDDYIRDQKLNSLAERSVGLPGMGPEDDVFLADVIDWQSLRKLLASGLVSFV